MFRLFPSGNTALISFYDQYHNIIIIIYKTLYTAQYFEGYTFKINLLAHVEYPTWHLFHYCTFLTKAPSDLLRVNADCNANITITIKIYHMNLSVQSFSPEALGYCFILLASYYQHFQRRSPPEHLSGHVQTSGTYDGCSLHVCSRANTNRRLC